MKSQLASGVVLFLLLLVVGVPMVFRFSQARADQASEIDTDLKLVIISPHNEQIRFEIAQAFNRWRESRDEPRVVFDWRSGGGTSDLRRQVLAEFESKALRGLEDEGVGYDLFFGGGEFEHNLLMWGPTIERDGEDVSITCTQPIRLPEGMLETVFPEPTIGGERLYEARLSWVGPVLSSFGIIYNRDSLQRLGLPEPITWADMADPRYQGWVALADPAQSGSIAATYNVIVRRLGWKEGWALLRRTFANSRYFTSSASKVPVDVSSGEAAAGMCIDFYGRYQAGAIGGDRVGYVDPPGMTAITADPISILRGAPHADLANEFVIWLLSRESQTLWQRGLSDPQGPEQFELRRVPARRDVYTPEERARWVDDVDPFAIARPFAAGMPDFYFAMAPLSHAIAIDIHDDLKAAWAIINESPDHPQRQAMLEAFDRLPDNLAVRGAEQPLSLVVAWPDQELSDHWLTILDDPGHPRQAEVADILRAFRQGLSARWRDAEQRLNDRLALTRFFQQQYREVVRLGRSR